MDKGQHFLGWVVRLDTGCDGSLSLLGGWAFECPGSGEAEGAGDSFQGLLEFDFTVRHFILKLWTVISLSFFKNTLASVSV